LVSREPVHLLDPTFKSWRALREDAMQAVISELGALGARLSDRTWGEKNAALIRHPLSRAIPALGGLLDMPRDALNGDDHMPRVASPTNGASERFVVSPGREEEGIFHMPVGQAAHPLSPYFGAGHGEWVNGERAPFLPGPTVYSLTLQPR
jgi:penicillin amidase